MGDTMDDERFDRIAAAVATGSSRRGVIRLISGGGLLAALGVAGSDATAAKKNGKKKKKCTGNKKKCGKRCIPRSSCCTSSACEQGEICRNGRCSNCVSETDCPQPPVCQERSCRDGRCETVPLPVGTACDDGQFCTVGTTCDQDGLCGGFQRNCNDGIACTDDICDEDNDACVHTPNDSFCPGNETCNPQVDCVCPPLSRRCEPGLCISQSQQCP
jgi:hypothetical protein